MTTAERVTVAEAARLLGITEAAVRQRIRRGTIPTVRIDGTVWVVTAALPTGEAPGTVHADGTTATPPDHPADSTRDATAILSILERENALLRDQLTIKDRQIGELHVLLQSTQRSLPAAVVEHLTRVMESSEVEPLDEPKRASWWRRLFRQAI